MQYVVRHTSLGFHISPNILCRAEEEGDRQRTKSIPVTVSRTVYMARERPVLGLEEGKYSQKVGIRVSSFVF